jgi:fructoselysine-6-P-deglycase FrlB-like protein
MSPPDFGEAILAQPANLAEAADSFRAAVASADVSRLSSGTLVLSGIGASAHALIPAVVALRAAGVRAFAVSSAELRDACRARLGDAYVLVSQSGASVETLEAVEALNGAPVVAVSARGDSPLARAADLWLPLGPRADTPVATLSYTATLQTLGMLCGLLTGSAEDQQAWDRLPEIAIEVLERAGPVADELAPAFAGIHALDAAGGGAAAASAAETSLLAREALKLPGAGMETREYLHGPLEPVDEGFGCIVFGREREHVLAHSLAGYGAVTLLITDRLAADPSGATVIKLPEVAPLAAPILQIMPVQLLVERVAARRGLAIGPLTRQQDDTKVSV